MCATFTLFRITEIKMFKILLDSLHFLLDGFEALLPIIG